MVMGKRERKPWFFHRDFFPKNRRGQFFLVMSLVIIGLVAGLTGISNSVQKKSEVKFYHIGEELKYESDKTMDYAIINELDMEEVLTNFSKDYSKYSNADGFYYIFGTTSKITFVGLNKNNSGTIKIDAGSGEENIELIQNQFYTENFDSPNANIKLVVNGVNYPFTLRNGENFYFVISKELDGDIYTATNG